MITGKTTATPNSQNKQQSQKEFLSFIDEPSESERWKREGIYGSVVVGPVGKQTKIILLDTRYFRDSEDKGLSGGDILGERQWQWLRQELLGSLAQIHILVSGTQVLPHDKPFLEKWANYPKSYNRLFHVLAETKPAGVVFLSGDIHYAEVMRKDCVGLGYPVYEITSSGLTHSCGDYLHALCQLVLDTVVNTELQIGVYPFKNFGTM